MFLKQNILYIYIYIISDTVKIFLFYFEAYDQSVISGILYTNYRINQNKIVSIQK